MRFSLPLTGCLGIPLMAACTQDSDPRADRQVPEGVWEEDPPTDPDTGEPEPDSPSVHILSPTDGGVAENPVTFRFETTGSGEITYVVFICEGWRLHEDDIAVSPGIDTFTYDFNGVNYQREVILTGYGDDDEPVSQDSVAFIPDEGWLAEEQGFNRYVVYAINDTSLYPKDGTYPYCWSYYGSVCGDMWGMIWGGWYLDEHLFDGGYDCFCSGHTLEIFLNAYERYQADHDLEFWEPYGSLTIDDVDLGAFYQYWQGYGITYEASAAAAFEYAGIGEELPPSRWDEATTGDFVNLSRSTGSGHSVIFVDWVYEAGKRVGLRYYACNGSGDSHPDDTDPDNVSNVSGPSFVTEYFQGSGGTVLPSYLFIGHPYDPTTL